MQQRIYNGTAQVGVYFLYTMASLNYIVKIVYLPGSSLGELFISVYVYPMFMGFLWLSNLL